MHAGEKGRVGYVRGNDKKDKGIMINFETDYRVQIPLVNILDLKNCTDLFFTDVIVCT